MFKCTFKCPKGHITTDIHCIMPSARSCGICGAKTMAERIEVEEIGACECCKDPYELDWECPDEPHHGEDTECAECGATYYQDFGGTLYATNEQAKKNFNNNLPTL